MGKTLFWSSRCTVIMSVWFIAPQFLPGTFFIGMAIAIVLLLGLGLPPVDRVDNVLLFLLLGRVYYIIISLSRLYLVLYLGPK